MRLVVADLMIVGVADTHTALWSDWSIAAAIQEGFHTSGGAAGIVPPDRSGIATRRDGRCPPWLTVLPVDPDEDPSLESLGAGERAARYLGILRLAAQQGWLDLADVFQQLKRTNFRYRQETMDALVREWNAGH